ncbi:MAG: hypothetical protein GY913_05710 [Proteobacteria bacterium]|nr:hypothetical protein [Pseudomonadota bacterium]MCP4916400.1 hypothetical protein [Pseudomonadota bacterium]
MKTFDVSRAKLDGRDFFKRFRVTEPGVSLRSLKLAADTELVVIERGGQRLGFIKRELSYPHVAQGKLAGEPYLVSF